MTKRTAPLLPEVRERAVRMVFDHQGEHGSQYGAIRSIAAKLGCSGETLRNRVRQAERDRGQRAGPTTDERDPSDIFYRTRALFGSFEQTQTEAAPSGRLRHLIPHARSE